LQAGIQFLDFGFLLRGRRLLLANQLLLSLDLFLLM
jgi:hypothetical protein